jgi:hypothetical protein
MLISLIFIFRNFVDIDDQPDIDELCKMVFNKSARTLFVLDRENEYPKYRLKCKRSPKLLDDVVATKLAPLKLPNSALHSEFEKVIQLIGSSGLLEFYVKTMRWNRYTKELNFEEEDPLHVFSLEDLGFGFVPWLCACALSIIAFLLEIIWSLLKVMCSRILLKYSSLV